MIKTLFEAISHAREVAKEKRELIKTICPWADDGEETRNECLECADEHDQLGDYLTELAGYRAVLEEFVNPNNNVTRMDAMTKLMHVYSTNGKCVEFDNGKARVKEDW